MQHVLPDLAHERIQTMLATAAEERDARRAREHRRVVRRAERAERRVVSKWDEARRLRAHLRELESAG